jgi:sulfur carrier protein
MNIWINGENIVLSHETMNLHELITEKGLIPGRIVIEVNLEIIPRERWSSVQVREHDQIEIVSFVGGG